MLMQEHKRHAIDTCKTCIVLQFVFKKIIIPIQISRGIFIEKVLGFSRLTAHAFANLNDRSENFHNVPQKPSTMKTKN